MTEKLILTDCDGVLLNWEYAFQTWLQSQGFKRVTDDIGLHYDIGKQYDMSSDEVWKHIVLFNQSAAIGFLPPLRDAIHYVKKLHEEHGYMFHVISSLSKDVSAQRLRTQNLQKLFGDSCWDGFTYLDTGADKHEALEKYRDRGLYFVEDKTENCELAYDYGLKGLLMEHGHNMHHTHLPKYVDWKSIAEDLIKKEQEND